MRFKKSGERFIKIEHLRKTFQIEPEKYPRFTDFRRRVIEPSVKEIEEKTDWVISWEPVKTGRQITSLSFFFEKRILNTKKCGQ